MSASHFAFMSVRSTAAVQADPIARPSRPRTPLASVGGRLVRNGPVGNSRITGLTAVLLLVLLAVEGATLLSLQSLLRWHVVIGMLLVPLVVLKLASTGYRFARYYTGHRAYVRAGPPPPLLRLLGPVVVLATVVLFGTGVALAVLGPGTRFVLPLHKASFVVWFGAMSLHVLGHLLHLPGLVRPDLPGSRERVHGSRLRVGLVAAAVVAGAVVAVASWPLADAWLQWQHAFHRFG